MLLFSSIFDSLLLKKNSGRKGSVKDLILIRLQKGRNFFSKRGTTLRIGFDFSLSFLFIFFFPEDANNNKRE
jgi:hypothetical protein